MVSKTSPRPSKIMVIIGDSMILSLITIMLSLLVIAGPFMAMFQSHALDIFKFWLCICAFLIGGYVVIMGYHLFKK